MNGMILYPTDDEIMVLNIINTVNSFNEILEGLPEPLNESMWLILTITHRAGVNAIINAYASAFDYNPLKINETVLG